MSTKWGTDQGGENGIKNYVTACWKCNLSLSNKLQQDGKPKPNKLNLNAQNVNWDGFSSLYLKLIKKDDSWSKLLRKYLEK